MQATILTVMDEQLLGHTVPSQSLYSTCVLLSHSIAICNHSLTNDR